MPYRRKGCMVTSWAVLAYLRQPETHFEGKGLRHPWDLAGVPKSSSHLSHIQTWPIQARHAWPCTRCTLASVAPLVGRATPAPGIQTWPRSSPTWGSLTGSSPLATWHALARPILAAAWHSEESLASARRGLGSSCRWLKACLPRACCFAKAPNVRAAARERRTALRLCRGRLGS